MSESKTPLPLVRGRYRLESRPDRKYLQIAYYDPNVRRVRYVSTGTNSVEQAEAVLNRMYLQDRGEHFCPSCGRPVDRPSPLVSVAIDDYLTKKEGTAGHAASVTRAAYLFDFLGSSDTLPLLTCAAVTDLDANAFRAYMATRSHRDGAYSASSVEGALLLLRAAINAVPGEDANFVVHDLGQVANTPRFRADVATLARMFEDCLNPHGRTDKERRVRRRERRDLLTYLRLGVATLARPDALHDLCRAQWQPYVHILSLNPAGRPQTAKRRPDVLVPRQIVPLLDSTDAGRYIKAKDIKAAWGAMRERLGLSGHRESGPKLLRRSMAQLVRNRLTAHDAKLLSVQLGHLASTTEKTTDFYASAEDHELAPVVRVIETIIDEIERLAPGAFTDIY